MGWFLSLTGIKGWIYGGAAAILASLIGLFVWRGYEIDSLRERLQAAQKTAQTAQDTIQVIQDVRNHEIKSQKEAQSRAEQIKKTPTKDNGAIAPVLRDSLSRL